MNTRNTNFTSSSMYRIGAGFWAYILKLLFNLFANSWRFDEGMRRNLFFRKLRVQCRLKLLQYRAWYANVVMCDTRSNCQISMRVLVYKGEEILKSSLKNQRGNTKIIHCRIGNGSTCVSVTDP